MNDMLGGHVQDSQLMACGHELLPTNQGWFSCSNTTQESLATWGARVPCWEACEIPPICWAWALQAGFEPLSLCSLPQGLLCVLLPPNLAVGT